MPRIRTIKPEFWTDDLLGTLSREARLLFIGAWNQADDEGLLRWTAPTLKGAIFPFDDDIGITEVEGYMRELEACEVIFPYLGGRSQQKLAYIVNFLKHQKINRPSPSKLPPPSIQSPVVQEMYAKRDGYACHLCGGEVDKLPTKYDGDFCASPDHLQPVSRGGGDYPSNIRTAHVTCNKGRGNRSREEYLALIMKGKTAAQFRYPERFMHVVVSDSLSDSVPEEEREQGAGIEEEEKKEPAADFTKDFETFWGAYPKKADKGHALKAYIAARKLGASAETLLAGAARYRADPSRDPKFTKNAQGWLSGECWNDQAAEPPPPVKFEPQAVKDAQRHMAYAAMIQKGISPGLQFTTSDRNKMIAAGLVTMEQCERAGCAA
jgi:hypothetical protein